MYAIHVDITVVPVVHLGVTWPYYLYRYKLQVSTFGTQVQATIFYTPWSTGAQLLLQRTVIALQFRRRCIHACIGNTA